jgi:hypothetical protein
VTVYSNGKDKAEINIEISRCNDPSSFLIKYSNYYEVIGAFSLQSDSGRKYKAYLLLPV